MANWNNPTLTSSYTNFVTEVKDRDVEVALWFEGMSPTNLPTNAKRLNTSTGRFEKWNGTAWVDASTVFTFPAAAVRSSVAAAVMVLSAPVSTVPGASNEINFQDSGTSKWALGGGNIGSAAGNNFSLYNYTTMANVLTILAANSRVGFGTNAPSYLVDVNGTFGVSGAATFAGTATFGAATTFNAAATFNGNVTIGDASADTATVNATLTFATAPSLTPGTANGLVYLNASKVLTAGSELTFTGTNFGLGNATPLAKAVIRVNGNGTAISNSALHIQNNNAAVGSAVAARITFNADGGDAIFAFVEQRRDGSDTFALGSTAATPVLIFTGNSERLRLDGAGNMIANAGVTGYWQIPRGSTAQRPASPASGMLRFNSTLGKFEGHNGSSWASVGGGATGGGSDDVFYENGQTVTTNYTITSGKNAMSAGPVTISSGITVTVPSGSTWVVV